MKRKRTGGTAGPPLQIPGSVPVDVAVYTALVRATVCNISLLPARPYFLPNIQHGRQ